MLCAPSERLTARLGLGVSGIAAPSERLTLRVAGAAAQGATAAGAALQGQIPSAGVPNECGDRRRKGHFRGHRQGRHY